VGGPQQVGELRPDFRRPMDTQRLIAELVFELIHWSDDLDRRRRTDAMNLLQSRRAFSLYVSQHSVHASDCVVAQLLLRVLNGAQQGMHKILFRDAVI
jgi:hypothetical protein